MSSQITTINLGGGPEQIGKPLISDDEIDRLINSQIKVPPTPIPIPLPPQAPPTPTQPEVEEEPEKENDSVKFDMDSMNKNLDAITTSTKNRITDLINQQSKLKARVSLLEKFINLDEKELAIEVSKTEPNNQKVVGIRKSILNQTELFGQTLDILLKFESQIQSWTKTLLDIEKDKVGAFQKIRSVSKEQTSTETDINEVLLNINNIIRNDPGKVLQSAEGFLNINGYSGKKFEN